MEHENNCSCHQPSNFTVTQTISEMDFERGIWTAVIYNEVERVKDFIRKGQTNARDNSGYTPLHYAARSGNENICRMLIEDGADVNAVTNGRATALHRAAMMGHLRIVKLLINSGAQINSQDEDGQTALHRSTSKGNYVVAKYLVDCCDKLKIVQDKKGRTPYDLITVDNKQLEALLEVIK